MQKPSDKNRKTTPFCFRLTECERALLEAKAGNVPLGVYVRRRVLEGQEEPRPKSRKPKPDEQVLCRVLAALGKSRLSSNLNQIAKAANIGALPLTPDLIDDLTQACAEVREMRSDLVSALGLKEGQS